MTVETALKPRLSVSCPNYALNGAYARARIG
jgi:hypothetical protein